MSCCWLTKLVHQGLWEWRRQHVPREQDDNVPDHEGRDGPDSLIQPQGSARAAMRIAQARLQLDLTRGRSTCGQVMGAGRLS
mmetsp:Transcript_64835/g.189723  ORF Transcript_64835/g.189723 Transcript_64835/m.189723 type:complete len:82 (+) Transcript_64835:835-1080(+)